MFTVVRTHQSITLTHHDVNPARQV